MPNSCSYTNSVRTTVVADSGWDGGGVGGGWCGGVTGVTSHPLK